MEPVFMRLGAGDAHFLLDAEEDVFDNEIDIARAELFLQDDWNVLVVAMDQDRVIGQIAAVLHQHIDAPPDLYIDNLGVTPGRQRQGVATRLIEMALDIGRQLGGPGAWVAVDQDNTVAHSLYGKTGAAGSPIMMFSYRP